MLGTLWGMAQLSEMIKQDLVLIIKSVVENFYGVVPVVRLRYMVWHQTNILEVSVLDVLNQPILGPVSDLSTKWCVSLLELGLEVVMFNVVAIAIIIRDFAELRLFIVEMPAKK